MEPRARDVVGVAALIFVLVVPIVLLVIASIGP
jgi:hypothetical protein